jgi:hypothetical protein
MTEFNKFNSLFPKLINTAQTSTINSKLAAVIVKGQKMVSRPCPNTERNICRGNVCGSLHAEAHAILDYYGRNLSYTPKLGWCLLRHRKRKENKR